MASVPITSEPTMAQQAFAREPGVSPRGWFRVRNSHLGWGISAGLHLAALGLAALIGLTIPGPPARTIVESAWSTEEIAAELIDSEAIVTEFSSPESGGRWSETDGHHMLPTENHLHAEGPTNVTQLTSVLARSETQWTAGELTAQAPVARSSHGHGTGQGDGLGAGDEFFGLPVTVAQRVVFVVDNSRSMNHPYDGPGKTRFKRVQMELVKSIWQLEPHQEFYVIFFNQDALPMPAVTLQPALPVVKQEYLTWVAERKAAGSPTDPRKAMELALSFQPDLIYFLTDGEFHKRTNHQLRQIRQRRTAINTFAFGEKLGEAVLSDIAKNNQGKYTYIP